jgi:hypothetical protein
MTTSVDLNATKATTRVYKPKSAAIKFNNEHDMPSSPSPLPRANANSAFLLTSPHYIVRFRTPRVKSKLKLQLEELQVISYDDLFITMCIL